MLDHSLTSEADSNLIIEKLFFRQRHPSPRCVGETFKQNRGYPQFNFCMYACHVQIQ